MGQKEDYFSKKWQLNARIRGRYDEIAIGMNKCVFCDLKKKYIITEDSGLVLTVNLFPYTTGHLLIIPQRHVENYLDLNQKEIIAHHRLARIGLGLLRRVLDIKSVWLLLRDGYQVGKTVKHLHWQIMPYVEGVVDWHYQKIEIEPERLAKMLRKANERKNKIFR